MKRITKTESEASEAVSDMFDQQVAFFNIGKKHAFFLCSPDEARHAMDCIRDWRDGWNSLQNVKAARDAFKAKALADRAWENVPARRQVISTGGSLSLAALNQSFATIEHEFSEKGPTVDIIVVSAIRLADIRNWGVTIYDHASAKDKKERGVHFTNLFGTDVYLDNDLPYGVVLIGSLPCGKWQGACSKVEVVSDYPVEEATREDDLGKIVAGHEIIR